ncbi:MAG: PAAR domain-containing protein [Pseudomonadota bacterium]
MKIIGWIRHGDKAACGGTVVEGHPAMTSRGRQLTYYGAHMACKKNCVIVEACIRFTLPNGKSVPHHGHRTSGGCPLLSTLNDIHGLGNESAAQIPDSFVEHQGQWVEKKFDMFFHVKHEKTGKVMGNMPYKITLDDGSEFKGVTDNNGDTEKVFSDSAQNAKIEVPYHDNSAAHTTIGSDACGC